MGLREKAVRGIGWSAAQNWGNQAIKFAFFLVLAWFLDPATSPMAAGSRNHANIRKNANLIA